MAGILREDGGADAQAEFQDLTGELDEVLARSGSDELKEEALFIKAWIAGDPFGRKGSAKGYDAQARAVEEFIARFPGDKRGAELLSYFAAAYRDDPARLAALRSRIVKDYPDTIQAERVRKDFDRLASAGKAFDLTFRDAINDVEISTRNLRGKIIVVAFWATWCGPCIAEMPNMKELYARYHDKGVEFLGVSLDRPREEGGLDKLKAFVAKNEIPWPQYYQGNGGDSEFSTGWGVQSIPAVFLVDQDGKIFSAEARENLEALILDLMKRNAPKGGGAGER